MGLSPHVNKISNKWKDTLGMKPKILTLSKYLGPDHTTVRNSLGERTYFSYWKMNLWLGENLLSEHIFHLWTKQYDPLSVLENGGIYYNESVLALL